MVETIVNEIMSFLQDKIPEELVAFVISLCPVLECRGGMIAARLMEIPFLKAFLICYLGNREFIGIAALSLAMTGGRIFIQSFRRLRRHLPLQGRLYEDD